MNSREVSRIFIKLYVKQDRLGGTFTRYFGNPVKKAFFEKLLKV